MYEGQEISILKLEYLGDVDWYKFTTNEEIIDYTISFRDVVGSLYFNLYDKDGNIIRQSNAVSPQNGSVKLNLDMKSTYYIQIFSSNRYYTQVNRDYSLSIY